jgi:NAD(P) transhydrogenase subunit beta
MIDDWGDAIIDLAYFASALLLIYSLNRLSQPATARLGNQLAMVAVGVATVATFFLDEVENNYLLIFIGIALGAVIGSLPAQRVPMTSMPQMVAIFNGLGGGAAALIAVTEFLDADDVGRGVALSIVLSAIIGAISATGSAVAYGKLQGLLPSRTTLPWNRQVISVGLIGGMALLGLIMVLLESGTDARVVLIVTFLVALVAGVVLVLPIGGADMPVVIAMLNSLTGISAALTGITLSNQVLVVAGALVGASGGFLTLLMARAMNRSVANVIFGSFGAPASKGGASEAAAEDRPIREVTPEDAAVSLAYADRVIVVPGYGLAVAQAQHAVQELANALHDRGVDVRFAIHPVAGRMPGHMNVLLAEANVPYDDLYEMDRINDEFAHTNVVLVIGANDVTNPAARDDPTSPIYGMPILRVDEAESVVVLKRSMGSGFAGVENALFHDPKTAMLFGDAKDSLTRLISEVKAA